ncbi:MAG: prepilin-type N-terminal cleavage/methylation domain-containing protein [Deltaproteobacteria bacterium]|nr:prepilin-type N-terminal cleavage/methylation domain-containing protein [Deltaproteobacteria bacterium]
MRRVKTYKRFADDAGFTLIELSIVLIIIGIVLALGVGLLGPMLKEANVAKAKETIDGTMESIQGFVAANKRVPCCDETSYGPVCDYAPTCDSVPDEFTPILKTPTDPWGSKINYIFDNNLTYTAADGGDICGRRSTLLVVRQCLTEDCVTTAGIDYTDITNVAYVAWSFGPNSTNQMLGNTYPAGTAITTRGILGPGTTTLYVAPLGTLNIPTNSDLEYDDVVKWITIDELRVKAGCEGAPLRIVNNELPAGHVSSDYTATLYADGGAFSTAVTNYRWCIQTQNGALADLPGFANPDAIVFNTDCQGLAEASWTQAADFDLTKASGSGTTGSYSLTVFVRDDNGSGTVSDNVASRAFVLTVSP